MSNSNFYGNFTKSQYYNISGNHGSYQYQTLDELVNTFMVIYVGENKIIPKADRNDVYFFGRRALQEMNYDVLRSKKTWEFELDNRMYIPMPHDFVGYTNVFRVDSKGIKLPLYPTKDTQNPFRPKPKLADNKFEERTKEYYDKIGGEYPNHIDDWWETAHEAGPATRTTEEVFTGEYELDEKGREDRESPIMQEIVTINHDQVYTGVVADNTDDEAGLHSTGYNLDSNGDPVLDYTSSTLSAFASSQSNTDQDYDNKDETYQRAYGQRYGLDPVRSQNNGSYYFDYANGRLYFGPSLIGETLVLDYITDGLADGGDALIHKFAEEAWYKHVAYGIVSTGSNYNPATIQMLKKERFAETRKAKLRLSNLKLQEIEQVMRGKSKWIKS